MHLENLFELFMHYLSSIFVCLNHLSLLLYVSCCVVHICCIWHVLYILYLWYVLLIWRISFFSYTYLFFSGLFLYFLVILHLGSLPFISLWSCKRSIIFNVSQYLIYVFYAISGSMQCFRESTRKMRKALILLCFCSTSTQFQL